MVSFEFSIFDLVTMMAVLILAVLYALLLLKLRPSTENKEHQKRDLPPKKPELKPDGLVFINSLKTKENTTPLQKTQNPITEQKIRSPPTHTERTMTPPDGNLETPKHVAKAENRSFNSDCIHYFGYLRKLPKSTSIPSECLGCRKVVECLTTKIETTLVDHNVT